VPCYRSTRPPLARPDVAGAPSGREIPGPAVTIELDGIAAIAGPFAVRGVKRGMDTNLAALKTILER
jgi:hypothetical protein